MQKATCANCHVQKAAGDSCLTCHNYHIGHLPPAMPNSRFGQGRNNRAATVREPREPHRSLTVAALKERSQRSSAPNSHACLNNLSLNNHVRQSDNLITTRDHISISSPSYTN